MYRDYLGDGVYVELTEDGQIRLMTERSCGRNNEEWDEIFMDKPMLTNLHGWYLNTLVKIAEHNEQQNTLS